MNSEYLHVRAAGDHDTPAVLQLAPRLAEGVAVCKASITGVITIREQRHFTGELDGYIGELAVAAHEARRGIGRALIAAAETWARDRGLRHLTLHTGIANIPARDFYAALGFREEEIRLTRPL